MSSLRIYWTVIAFTLVFTSCGGASRPGALQHHMDEMFIARVPIDQKRAVLDAQQEWQLAKLAWQEAKQEYEESNTNIRLAENERKQAALEKSSAKERQKAADKTGDLTQINDATLVERAAKLAYLAAEKKVAYLKAVRDWRRVYVDYAEDEMYVKEAQYELAKARTAQNNNIRPKGVKFERFQQQSEKRARYSQRTKGKVDQKKAKANQVEKEWQKLDKDAQIAAAQVNGAPPVDPETKPMDDGQGQGQPDGANDPNGGQ